MISKRQNNRGTSDQNHFKVELSLADFNEFSDFIYTQFGIKMPPVKRVMLQGRLLKRLRDLNMDNYTEYKKYIFSSEGYKKEIYNFLNVVTTNKTDFFREPAHFDFLQKEVLPSFYNQFNGRAPIKIWSSACSSGEELYTIAMVINEFKLNNPNLIYQLLGTDISRSVLEKAAKGIYDFDRASIIPLELKKRYLLKSKDTEAQTVKVQAQLQRNLTLRYLNLMDDSYGEIERNFDVIFCRNVLIYFDRETQEKVVRKLCQHLNKGGYLFIGHSESLNGMDLPLNNIKPTIFQKQA